MKRHISLLVLCFVATLLAPMTASAENSTAIPGYTVHHNAFTTDTLTPHIARRFHVQRSKNRGMLNVSIIKNEPVGIGKPVRAEVEVTATNLSGQLSNITIREVREGTAVYYLGDFKVNHRETLNFVIKAKPEGEDQFYTSKLTQEFYTK